MNRMIYFIMFILFSLQVDNIYSSYIVDLDEQINKPSQHLLNARENLTNVLNRVQEGSKLFVDLDIIEKGISDELVNIMLIPIKYQEKEVEDFSGIRFKWRDPIWRYSLPKRDKFNLYSNDKLHKIEFSLWMLHDLIARSLKTQLSNNDYLQQLKVLRNEEKKKKVVSMLFENFRMLIKYKERKEILMNKYGLVFERVKNDKYRWNRIALKKYFGYEQYDLMPDKIQKNLREKACLLNKDLMAAKVDVADEYGRSFLLITESDMEFLFFVHFLLDCDMTV